MSTTTLPAAAAVPIPPGPRGLPLVGVGLRFRRDPLGFVEGLGRYAEDVVFYRVGPGPTYFLKHPDYARDVLVTHQHDFVKGAGSAWTKRFLGEGLLTSEGAFHTRQRRLAQPAFHRQRIGSYGAVMVEYAARACARWRDGERLDAHREMSAVTLEIAAKTLFDADVREEVRAIGESLSAVIELFPRFALPFSGLIQRLPLPSNRRFARGRRTLDAIVWRIIRERRAAGVDRGDLLSMLMLARDEETGESMTDAQLRDEVMTLLMAGHETTANALSWTWYALAQNPEAERRLHAELDEVLGGRLPAMDDLPKLRYTEQVFAEAMRLFPPAWLLGRRALREARFGEFTVPAGALLTISPWLIQRDPRFWPDPLRFDPERFTPEAKAARPKFAYFPFGGGARMCIGESFAWMEGVLVIATLAQRFRLRLAQDRPVVPQALITLRPRHGVPVTVERRAH
jgi:cytochrome P450